jgi:putative flippase GtrA
MKRLALQLAQFRVVRFVVSGGIASVAHLAILYFLTDILLVWYLLSTTIGFSIGFVISFLLQKFWTYQDKNRDRITSQALLYAVIGALNLLTNSMLMYLLVDIFGVWHMLAQGITLLAIATVSFFVYGKFVFDSVSMHKDTLPE